jgi:hypothetical protein
LKEKSLRDETVQNSLALSLNREAAERLYSLMSGLSEQYWCSGWLSNLEHILWRYVVKREESKYRFSLAYISSEDVDKLLDLSEKAGGWWAYTDEPIRVSRFYPMKEWLEMYKEPKFEDPSED